MRRNNESESESERKFGMKKKNKVVNETTFERFATAENLKEGKDEGNK